MLFNYVSWSLLAGVVAGYSELGGWGSSFLCFPLFLSLEVMAGFTVLSSTVAGKAPCFVFFGGALFAHVTVCPDERPGKSSRRP